LAGIVSFVSGAPTTVSFTTTNGMDITGTLQSGAAGERRLQPAAAKGDRTFYKNFNTSCFQLPAVGTFGNARPDGIARPGIRQLRSFGVQELHHPRAGSSAVPVRSLHAFNHTQFSAFNTAAQFSPTGQQVNTNFGAYTAARNPRIGQLALKVTF